MIFSLHGQTTYDCPLFHSFTTIIWSGFECVGRPTGSNLRFTFCFLTHVGEELEIAPPNPVISGRHAFSPGRFLEIRYIIDPVV